MTELPLHPPPILEWNDPFCEMESSQPPGPTAISQLHSDLQEASVVLADLEDLKTDKVVPHRQLADLQSLQQTCRTLQTAVAGLTQSTWRHASTSMPLAWQLHTRLKGHYTDLRLWRGCPNGNL